MKRIVLVSRNQYVFHFFWIWLRSKTSSSIRRIQLQPTINTSLCSKGRNSKCQCRWKLWFFSRYHRQSGSTELFYSSRTERAHQVIGSSVISRTFTSSWYVFQPGIVSIVLIIFVAPNESSHYARSVREDTAELASFALSDRASLRSPSPSRQPTTQTRLESYFSQGLDDESISTSELPRQATIEEVSEPVSPASGPSSHQSPGTSIITSMLKRSPPSTSPQDQDGGQEVVENDENHKRTERNGRLIITSNGVERDVSERTPLLGNDKATEPRHDWIRGVPDIEGQELRRRTSWPRLRSVILWPKEKGVDVVWTVLNPKRWDRKAILQGVAAPFHYTPAVILGLLLNILDALSYGT